MAESQVAHVMVIQKVGIHGIVCWITVSEAIGDELVERKAAPVGGRWVVRVILRSSSSSSGKSADRQ